jgi:hypothetical protein
MPNLLDYLVSWATYDALGQLVFARQGALYRFTLEAMSRGEPSAVIDLEDLKPPVETPEDLPDGYTVPAVSGRNEFMENLNVEVLVLPNAGVKWADEVRRFGKDDLTKQIRLRRLKPCACYVTPGYSLMANHLVHVAEPAPARDPEVLKQACKSVFDCLAGLPVRTVAMKPIGRSSRWPYKVAARETVHAAIRYVGAFKGREVILVAEDFGQLVDIEGNLDFDPSWAWG